MMEDIPMSFLLIMSHSTRTEKGKGEKKVNYVSIIIYILSSTLNNDSVFVMCNVLSIKLMFGAKQKSQ